MLKADIKMRTYKRVNSDGSVVITRFDKNRSYSKKYESVKEYNDVSKSGLFTLYKIVFAPIYYPVKWMFQMTFFLIKGIYWDLPRFIYNKIKR